VQVLFGDGHGKAVHLNVAKGTWQKDKRIGLLFSMMHACSLFLVIKLHGLDEQPPLWVVTSLDRLIQILLREGQGLCEFQSTYF
jgi:hypothetical protein